MKGGWVGVRFTHQDPIYLWDQF